MINIRKEKVSSSLLQWFLAKEVGLIYIYGICSRVTYIYLLYTTEQLRINGLAQSPSSGSLTVLGVELTTFQSEVQHLNHWGPTATLLLAVHNARQSGLQCSNAEYRGQFWLFPNNLSVPEWWTVTWSEQSNAYRNENCMSEFNTADLVVRDLHLGCGSRWNITVKDYLTIWQISRWWY